MKKRYLIILFFVAVLLAGCGLKNSQAGQSNIQPKGTGAEAEPAVDQEKLTQDYETAVSLAMAEFKQNNEAAKARETVLNLKTPSQYLDLHLNLVIALDEVAQGQLDNDQIKIDSGLEKINDLTKQYSFIK